MTVLDWVHWAALQVVRWWVCLLLGGVVAAPLAWLLGRFDADVLIDYLVIGGLLLLPMLLAYLVVAAVAGRLVPGRVAYRVVTVPATIIIFGPYGPIPLAPLADPGALAELTVQAYLVAVLAYGLTVGAPPGAKWANADRAEQATRASPPP